MIRVINDDLSFSRGRKEIIDTCDTIEEAEKIQGDWYFFMTSLEEKKNGKWVRIEGAHEKLAKELNEIFPVD